MKYSKYSTNNNSTLTSAQLQEFLGLVNTNQDDKAFEYLKRYIDNPRDRRGRRRKSVWTPDE